MLLTIENILFTTALIIYVVTMLLYFLFAVTKKEFFSKIALITEIAALLMHLAAIVIRGIAAKRLPLTNQYEFASAFAFGLCLVTLIFSLRFKFRALGAFALPLAR